MPFNQATDLQPGEARPQYDPTWSTSERYWTNFLYAELNKDALTRNLYNIMRKPYTEGTQVLPGVLSDLLFFEYVAVSVYYNGYDPLKWTNICPHMVLVTNKTFPGYSILDHIEELPEPLWPRFNRAIDPGLTVAYLPTGEYVPIPNNSPASNSESPMLDATIHPAFLSGIGSYIPFDGMLTPPRGGCGAYAILGQPTDVVDLVSPSPQPSPPVQPSLPVHGLQVSLPQKTQVSKTQLSLSGAVDRWNGQNAATVPPWAIPGPNSSAQVGLQGLYIPCTKAAEAIVDLANAGQIHFATDRMQGHQITSGSVIVFREGKIKRWTDGHNWTQSRKGKGKDAQGYMVYRETNGSSKQSTGSQKVTTSVPVTKENIEETLHMTAEELDSCDIPPKEIAKLLLCNYTFDTDLKYGGLVKSSMKVEKPDGSVYRVMSFYRVLDVCNGTVRPFVP
ncbi:hypothetical protein Sste5346_008657 [Sporothrix stenoceras]|uniref:Uncharacterized protein n=1 Tax=Sporothrix stenoceras TaxID=5173 RepID=A0ABR3YPC6_9PEZI